MIDGAVPDDAGFFFADDPSGNSKELSADNQNTTKIGVIHNDAVPTLGTTNQNPQVDLNKVWLDSRIAADGHVWLYFAWMRDSNNGSGVIALEIGQNEAPAPCDFSGATSQADLIANCNPWANRTNGDVLYLWDQQGNSTDISSRTFDGTVFGTPQNLDATVAAAAFNGTGNQGELAVDLTATVFGGSNACFNIANILPSTVTGNSDTADYKDTVFFEGFSISNCGKVIIRKATDPSGLTGTFGFTHNLDTSADPDPTTFDLINHGSMMMFLVFDNIGDSPYTVTETSLEPGFDLTDISCTISNGETPVSTAVPDVDNSDVDINVAADETVDCTFTNTARGSITIVKNAIPDDSQDFSYSGDLGSFSLDDDGDADATLPNSMAFNDLVPDDYDVTETPVPAGWDLTGLSCTSDHAGGASTSIIGAMVTISLRAGENVTCTYENTKRGQIDITKTDDAGNALEGVTFSLFNDLAPLNGAPPKGNEDTDTTFDCTTDASGQCSFTNIVPGQYWVHEDAAPAGTAGVADQNVIVAAGATVSLNLENPRLHKVIVIVCHESTNTLAASAVIDDATSNSVVSLAEGAALPDGVDEEELCSFTGFTGLPHGERDISVFVGSQAHP